MFMKKYIFSVIIPLLTVLFFSSGVSAQQKQITGVITNAEGKGIPSATIIVMETQAASTTNDQGRFSIMAGTNQHLQITSVGYANQVFAIGKKAEMNITLQTSGKDLDQVVVTALGIKREKRSLGYAVQEIKGDEVNLAKDPNIVNSLSGKIAGVQVTSGGSSIGASSRITIRGNASLGNNTPLFVVDGTPISNSSASLDGLGGVDYGNVTSDIDANDIASVTVLKGSAAAALYGSRATNGVILITTKKGNFGAKSFGVDVSTSFVTDKPTYFLKFQNQYGGGSNGSEFIWKRDYPNLTYQDYAKQYSYNWVDGNGNGVHDDNPISWGPRLDAGLKLDQWSTGPNSPWVSRPNNIKDYYQTGNVAEQNVAVYSKSDKASGRLAFSRMDQKGIEWNTGQAQNTLSGNIILTPNTRLTVEANVNYLTKNSTIPQNGYSGSMIDFAWFQRDIDTKYMWQQFKKEGNKGYISPFLDNEYYRLTNTNKLLRNRLYGNTSAKYKVNDWFNIMGRVGTDFYNEFRKGITQSGSADNRSSGRGGQFSQTQTYNLETNADLILNFDKQFHDFRLSGLVGANYRDVVFKSIGVSASDLTVPDLFSISNVKGTPGATNYDSEKKSNSLYASADVSYKNYLFMGITGRNDWSSTLPSANRSYFYPSVNLGFVFTDALHIPSQILSYGKLRASVANVGGDTDPYRLSGTYSASSFGGVTLFSPGRTLPPLNLKPEKTSSFEIGTNLGFLKNRINLDVTYYDQKTTNQILSVPISSTTGYSSELINAGEIENKGVEITLNAGILKNTSGLSWDMTVNFASNKNFVNALYGDLKQYIIGTGPGGITTLATPGKAWGTLYGLGYMRDKSGQITVDANGVPMTSSLPKELGNVVPKWTGGIQNTFTYKKVQLAFLIDARWGSQFFSTTLWHGYYNGSAPITVANNVRETGVIVPGVTADGKQNITRVAAQDYYSGSWLWNNLEYPILDGSFIKLRELSISYPFNVSKLKAIHSLKIALVARNVAILYRNKIVAQNGIDPETGFGGSNSGVGWEDFQLPGTRSYGIKLNVGF
jgi:TonB-linked SusC/RagA family outer membrane protein